MNQREAPSRERTYDDIRNGKVRVVKLMGVALETAEGNRTYFGEERLADGRTGRFSVTLTPDQYKMLQTQSTTREGQ